MSPGLKDNNTVSRAEESLLYVSKLDTDTIALETASITTTLIPLPHPLTSLSRILIVGKEVEIKY